MFRLLVDFWSLAFQELMQESWIRYGARSPDAHAQYPSLFGEQLAEGNVDFGYSVLEIQKARKT